MANNIRSLGVRDFSRLFQINVGQLPSLCRKIIEKSDFRYSKLPPARRLRLMEQISEKIKNGDFAKAGKNSRFFWQNKWAEHKKRITSKNPQAKGLVPAYFNKPANEIFFRLDHGFITPLHRDFEINFHRVYKYWLFDKYLRGVNNIYEFGCGTGTTAALLSDMFPEKILYCYDWAQSSIDIIRLTAKRHGWNAQGWVFNMLKPDLKLKIEPDNAFLAVSSLEQLGSNFKKFIDYSIKKGVGLFLTMDSIEELYDPSDKYDRLAIDFMKKREYLSGYLNYLKKLESQNKIEILEVSRVGFGNMYQDFSHIVWKPVKIKNRLHKQP